LESEGVSKVPLMSIVSVRKEKKGRKKDIHNRNIFAIITMNQGNYCKIVGKKPKIKVE
jgi:hypothetical protein